MFLFSEQIRTKLASDFLEFEDYFIVDSMPLEICKKARHNRIKICKDEFETAPSKVFCASQNNWFYGYKLHGVCSITGIFHSLDITKDELKNYKVAITHYNKAIEIDSNNVDAYFNRARARKKIKRLQWCYFRLK